VHRLGFSPSRVGARQMVTHGHFQVNGKSVNIPSYQLKPGDKVTMKAGSRENGFYKKWWEQSQLSQNKPSWLEANPADYMGTVKNWPLRDEISFPVNEQLIVELYSK
jgi:small subunit ribosomal protein S4